MGSTADKFSGNVKQIVGEATDDKKLETKGRAQETKGDIKSRLKNFGDKLTDKLGHK